MLLLLLLLPHSLEKDAVTVSKAFSQSMHQSIPAVPIPPGNCGAFAHVVSTWGRAFAILSQPGDWALAYPGGRPGLLTHMFLKGS